MTYGGFGLRLLTPQLTELCLCIQIHYSSHLPCFVWLARFGVASPLARLCILKLTADYEMSSGQLVRRKYTFAFGFRCSSGQDVARCERLLEEGQFGQLSVGPV